MKNLTKTTIIALVAILFSINLSQAEIFPSDPLKELTETSVDVDFNSESLQFSNLDLSEVSTSAETAKNLTNTDSEEDGRNCKVYDSEGNVVASCGRCNCRRLAKLVLESL